MVYYKMTDEAESRRLIIFNHDGHKHGPIREVRGGFPQLFEDINPDDFPALGN
jgi:hypothetical protein